jgi:hypothetical protein
MWYRRSDPGMIASIIQHYTYHYSEIRDVPFFLTIALVVIIFIGFAVATSSIGDTGAVVAAAVILAAMVGIIIIATTTRWHDPYTAHRVRIQVVDPTNGNKIWVRAHKTQDGTWYPINGVKVQLHPTVRRKTNATHH